MTKQLKILGKNENQREGRQRKQRTQKQDEVIWKVKEQWLRTQRCGAPILCYSAAFWNKERSRSFLKPCLLQSTRSKIFNNHLRLDIYYSCSFGFTERYRKLIKTTTLLFSFSQLQVQVINIGLFQIYDTRYVTKERCLRNLQSLLCSSFCCPFLVNCVMRLIRQVIS